jgi:hypothetical protein
MDNINQFDNLVDIPSSSALDLNVQGIITRACVRACVCVCVCVCK